MGETMKHWDLGLTDKRSHHRLIIRVWASDRMAAERIFVCSGLYREYELRYVRENTYYTEPLE